MNVRLAGIPKVCIVPRDSFGRLHKPRVDAFVVLITVLGQHVAHFFRSLADYLQARFAQNSLQGFGLRLRTV